MERYSEIIGLPVICVVEGKKIGVIKDLIFSPNTRRIKAFLLENKRYEINKKVITLKDILSLGKDALIVNSKACIINYKKDNDNKELSESVKVNGIKMYSKTGNDLGIVKDIFFDYKNGTIEKVEVSDGLLQDIYEGRNLIPLFGKVEFGEESIIIDNEALEEMTNTGGGIKRFM